MRMTQEEYDRIRLFQRKTLNDTGKGHELQPKKSKYRAQKVVIDGILFHSKKEGARYQQLKMMEKSGQISNLTLQPSFILAPAVTICGKKKPALRYVADFQYTEAGAVVVEDCKGFRDKVFIIKRHLMMSVLSLTIRET
jgi:hypothetical protein